MTTREPSRTACRCRIWNLDRGQWCRSPEMAQETPLSTKRVRPPPTIGVMPGFFENEALRRHSGDSTVRCRPESGTRLRVWSASRQTVPMPCQTAKARNNAGKWPRFERTVPTPPTIGGMPGFFENEASRPNSGDTGAKPGSERSMPASGRLSAVRTSSLSVLDSCRSAAGSRLLILTVSRTRSRTRTHAHAKDASVPMITIGSPMDNPGSPQEREKEPKR